MYKSLQRLSLQWFPIFWKHHKQRHFWEKSTQLWKMSIWTSFNPPPHHPTLNNIEIRLRRHLLSLLTWPPAPWSSTEPIEPMEVDGVCVCGAEWVTQKSADPGHCLIALIIAWSQMLDSTLSLGAKFLRAATQCWVSFFNRNFLWSRHKPIELMFLWSCMDCVLKRRDF